MQRPTDPNANARGPLALVKIHRIATKKPLTNRGYISQKPWQSDYQPRFYVEKLQWL